MHINHNMQPVVQSYLDYIWCDIFQECIVISAVNKFLLPAETNNAPVAS